MSVQSLEHAPRSVRTERADTSAAATQDMNGIPRTRHAEPLVGLWHQCVSIISCSLCNSLCKRVFTYAFSIWHET